jgi:hypothetical protein
MALGTYAMYIFLNLGYYLLMISRKYAISKKLGKMLATFKVGEFTI